MIVVDASVAVRWFVNAPEFTAGRKLLQSGEPLIAPELIVAEATHAAWKLARAKTITVEHANALVAELPRAFTYLAPLLDYRERAFAIARELDHPVYDCFYLALAEASETRIATADSRLAQRAKSTPWAKRIKHLQVSA